jgi:hypothetical protein
MISYWSSICKWLSLKWPSWAMAQKWWRTVLTISLQFCGPLIQRAIGPLSLSCSSICCSMEIKRSGSHWYVVYMKLPSLLDLLMQKYISSLFSIRFLRRTVLFIFYIIIFIIQYIFIAELKYGAIKHLSEFLQIFTDEKRDNLVDILLNLQVNIISDYIIIYI